MQIPISEPAGGYNALPWKETQDVGIAWIPLALEDDRPEPDAENSSQRGSAAVLIRMLPGCGYAPHRHLGPEHVLVLAGGYSDARGTYRRGMSVHYPTGSSHAPVALAEPGPLGQAPEACILYAVAVGGIELLSAPPTTASQHATSTNSSIPTTPAPRSTVESVTDTLPIDQLVDALTSSFESGFRADAVVQLMQAYVGEHEDWRAFASWSDGGYTRNQIARNEHFELLLLCWGAGQESPIHNHEGQHCWMGVLEGFIEERRYCCPEDVRPGALTPRDADTFERGQVAFIQDEIGLHLVRSARDGAAVSLHLYATPYDSCSAYCPDTGKLTRKQLSNNTVRGVPVR